MRRSLLLLSVLLAPLAASCRDKPDAVAVPRKEDDPSVQAALNDPIMSDPDLTAQDLGQTGLITPEQDVQGAPIITDSSNSAGDKGVPHR